MPDTLEALGEVTLDNRPSCGLRVTPDVMKQGKNLND
jgi:hypothetical protein